MKITYKKGTKLVAYSLAALVFVSAITSCVKDNFDFDKLTGTEWNPNLAVPLIYSSLSIADMLAKQETQGLVTVDADNFCTLVYKSNLFSLVAGELIEIPNNQPPPYVATLNTGQISAFGLCGNCYSAV